MLNFLDEFLDNLSYWSIKFLIGFGILFWVAIIVLAIYGFIKTDPIVGETYHGIIIRESDLEIKE